MSAQAQYWFPIEIAQTFEKAIDPLIASVEWTLMLLPPRVVKLVQMRGPVFSIDYILQVVCNVSPLDAVLIMANLTFLPSIPNSFLMFEDP